MDKIIKPNGDIEIKLFDKLIITSTPTHPYTDDGLTCIGRIVVEDTKNHNRQILIPDTIYDNTYFGYDIAVTEDGFILAVGAPGQSIDGVKGVGCVYIYKLFDNRYIPIRTIRSTSLIPNLYYGSSLRINNRSLEICCLSLDLSINRKSKNCRIESIGLDNLFKDSNFSRLKHSINYRRLTDFK